MKGAGSVEATARLSISWPMWGIWNKDSCLVAEISVRRPLESSWRYRDLFPSKMHSSHAGHHSGYRASTALCAESNGSKLGVGDEDGLVRLHRRDAAECSGERTFAR